MSRIEIFGPRIFDDQKMSEFVKIRPLLRELILELKKDIILYDFEKQEDAFLEHPSVGPALIKEGDGLLPISLVDGEVKLMGAFPTNQQLGEWACLTDEELLGIVQKLTKNSHHTHPHSHENDGCNCGGDGDCDC